MSNAFKIPCDTHISSKTRVNDLNMGHDNYCRLTAQLAKQKQNHRTCSLGLRFESHMELWNQSISSFQVTASSFHQLLNSDISSETAGSNSGQSRTALTLIEVFALPKNLFESKTQIICVQLNGLVNLPLCPMKDLQHNQTKGHTSNILKRVQYRCNRQLSTS